MYQLIVENEKGEQLRLTNNHYYDVIMAEGTNPPSANINTSAVVGIDGTRFNSSRIGQRNIVLTINIHHPIERNRLELYRYFRVKRYVKLYYKNSFLDVYTTGYVETFENNPWSQLQQPQISIICPNPFWLSNSETTVAFSNSVALFEFPFSISSSGIEFSRLENIVTATINAGEIETGGIIECRATDDDILNPKFYNRTTNQFFGVNCTMQEGDIITVNTQKGEKSVSLLRSGAKINLLSARSSGSEWITFEPGENIVSYGADSGANKLRVKLSLVQRFEGV